MEANSTGGQGSRRAVAPSDDDDDDDDTPKPDFFFTILFAETSTEDSAEKVVLCMPLFHYTKRHINSKR